MTFFFLFLILDSAAALTTPYSECPSSVSITRQYTPVLSLFIVAFSVSLTGFLLPVAIFQDTVLPCSSFSKFLQSAHPVPWFWLSKENHLLPAASLQKRVNAVIPPSYRQNPSIPRL